MIPLAITLIVAAVAGLAYWMGRDDGAGSGTDVARNRSQHSAESILGTGRKGFRG